MKVELILPIARLRGKINSKSPFYFKTVNGKTFVQRCPNRSTKAPTPAQTAAKQRFAAIARIVARLEARDWLYRVEVIDLSDYAGCDLNGDPING